MKPGRPPKKKLKTARINQRITEDLAKDIARTARRHGILKTKLVHDAVLNHIAFLNSQQEEVVAG